MTSYYHSIFVPALLNNRGFGPKKLNRQIYTVLEVCRVHFATGWEYFQLKTFDRHLFVSENNLLLIIPKPRRLSANSLRCRCDSDVRDLSDLILNNRLEPSWLEVHKSSGRSWGNGNVLLAPNEFVTRRVWRTPETLISGVCTYGYADILRPNKVENCRHLNTLADIGTLSPGGTRTLTAQCSQQVRKKSISTTPPPPKKNDDLRCYITNRYVTVTPTPTP